MTFHIDQLRREDGTYMDGRTRAGERVVIYGAVHGIAAGSIGDDWAPRKWREDGGVVGSIIPDPNDIVGPWVEVADLTPQNGVIVQPILEPNPSLQIQTPEPAKRKKPKKWGPWVSDVNQWNLRARRVEIEVDSEGYYLRHRERIKREGKE